MDATASTTSTAQGRRVLPSRNRRGGPNVGNCETDLLILDSYKRQHEAGPIIPLDTPFLLTTNSKYAAAVPDDSDSAFRVNIVLNDSHFARPEVLKACREQEIIQTPDFESIAESSSVGGRMRPRGAEDESAETSDAAYEKRHRKFETFEKRQRLREKEKLRHEHYKLKERIDQLKSMESSAFMSLPASSFTPPPARASAELDEIVALGSPYAHINGIASHAEGERRRKEMLDNAYKLERRYAYLLPPDRLRKNQDDSTSSKKQIEGTGDESDTERISTHAGSSRKEAEALKLRLPARSSASTTPAPSPSASKPPAAKKPKGTGPSKHSAISRLRQESLSTPLSTARLQEEEEPAPSPHVDIEMPSPEPVRVSTPALSFAAAEVASQTPEVEVENIAAETPISEPVPQLPNGSAYPEVVHPAKQISSMLLRERVRSPDIDVEMADEGESEKEPSETEELEIETVTEMRVGSEHERASIPKQAPVSVPEIEATAIADKPRKRRGRKPKNAIREEQSAPPQAPNEFEVVKEISTRLEQTTVADQPGPSAGPESEVSRKALENAAVPAGSEYETVSTGRPRKRRRNIRRNSVGTPQSAFTAPITGESQSVASNRKPRIYTKSHYQKFTNSAGEPELTTSSLLIAALLKGQRNSSLRHNTAFGVRSPDLYLDKEFEFELPAWVLEGFDEGTPLPSNNLNGTGPLYKNPLFHGPAPPPEPASRPVAYGEAADAEMHPRDALTEEKPAEEGVPMQTSENEQIEQRETSLPAVATLEPTDFQAEEGTVQIDENAVLDVETIQETQNTEEKTEGTTPVDQLEPESESESFFPAAVPNNGDAREQESALTSPTVDTEPEDTRIKFRILSVPADPDEEELLW